MMTYLWDPHPWMVVVPWWAVSDSETRGKDHPHGPFSPSTEPPSGSSPFLVRPSAATLPSEMPTARGSRHGTLPIPVTGKLAITWTLIIGLIVWAIIIAAHGLYPMIIYKKAPGTTARSHPFSGDPELPLANMDVQAS